MDEKQVTEQIPKEPKFDAAEITQQEVNKIMDNNIIRLKAMNQPVEEEVIEIDADNVKTPEQIVAEQKIITEARKRAGLAANEALDAAINAPLEVPQSILNPIPKPPVIDNVTEQRILNEKRQNCEQAMRDYFVALITFRRQREEWMDIDYTIQTVAWDQPVINKKEGAEDEILRTFSSVLKNQNGGKISREYMQQLREETYLAVRIAGATVRRLKEDAVQTWKLTEEDFVQKWQEWFGVQ